MVTRRRTHRKRRTLAAPRIQPVLRNPQAPAAPRALAAPRVLRVPQVPRIPAGLVVRRARRWGARRGAEGGGLPVAGFPKRPPPRAPRSASQRSWHSPRPGPRGGRRPGPARRAPTDPNAQHQHGGDADAPAEPGACADRAPRPPCRPGRGDPLPQLLPRRLRGTVILLRHVAQALFEPIFPIALVVLIALI